MAQRENPARKPTSLHEKGLSIETLQTFHKVANAGSIRAAANGNSALEKLYAKHLRDLDKHFGVRLRAGKEFALTHAGRRLEQIANDIITLLEGFETVCSHQLRVIRIGGGDRLLHWVLIPKLRAIQSKLPDCQIELHGTPNKNVFEALGNFTLDLGLVRTAEIPKGIKSESLEMKLEYSLFVQKAELLSSYDGTPNWVIRNIPVATVQKYQDAFLEAMRKAGIGSKIQLLCDTFPQARRAVASGYAAILPSLAFAPEELQSIEKLPLPFPLPTNDLDIALVWHRRTEIVLGQDDFEMLKSAFVSKLKDPAILVAPKSAISISNTKKRVPSVTA